MKSSYRQNNRIVIRCAHCKEKLRVPLDKGKIRVTCPNCKKEFVYNPDSILQTLKQILLSARVGIVNLPRKLAVRRKKH